MPSLHLSDWLALEIFATPTDSFTPERIAAERRQQLAWGASPRYDVMIMSPAPEGRQQAALAVAPPGLGIVPRFTWGSRPRLIAVAAPRLDLTFVKAKTLGTKLVAR